MDVARLGPTGQLIAIEAYALLLARRGSCDLICAGRTATGQQCGGRVFARALHSAKQAPHFYSRHHAPGCDLAKSGCGLHASSHAETRPAPLTLVPGRLRRLAAAAPSASRPLTRHASSATRLTLESALRTVLREGFPTECQVRWRGEVPVAASDFFIHFDSAAQECASTRGYWGEIRGARTYRPTGAVHLLPHATRAPRVVLPPPVVEALRREMPDLERRFRRVVVLAVGRLRRSRTGHPYVLVLDRGSLLIRVRDTSGQTG